MRYYEGGRGAGEALHGSTALILELQYLAVTSATAVQYPLLYYNTTGNARELNLNTHSDYTF